MAHVAPRALGITQRPVVVVIAAYAIIVLTAAAAATGGAFAAAASAFGAAHGVVSVHVPVALEVQRNHRAPPFRRVHVVGQPLVRRAEVLVVERRALRGQRLHLAP